MKRKFKILSAFSLLFIMLTLVGCGNNTSNNDAGNNDTTNNATNNANNNADNKKTPPTNQEYYDYLKIIVPIPSVVKISKSNECSFLPSII